jgi:hypothetical protein
MILVTEALEALGITNYKLEGNPTNEAEFNSNFIKITGVDADGVELVSTTPADFGITWTEVTAKMTALETEKPLNELRQERNRIISESDWMANSDVTMSDAWRTYRQALRDITNTYSSLNDVVWPTKPE